MEWVERKAKVREEFAKEELLYSLPAAGRHTTECQGK